MNIYALTNHKVICIALGSEIAIQNLQIDAIYTIEKTIVGKYQTEVYLQEIPNIVFNSIDFKDVFEQSIKDNKKHRDYWKYNKWWKQENNI